MNTVAHARYDLLNIKDVPSITPIIQASAMGTLTFYSIFSALHVFQISLAPLVVMLSSIFLLHIYEQDSILSL
jgi:hypothetical protein